MTSYQPYQHAFWYRLGIIMVITLIGVVSLFLIALYSRTVSIRHEIASAKTSFKEVMIESTEFQKTLFETVTDESLHALALERGLILDSDPIYFEVPEQWLFATQY